MGVTSGTGTDYPSGAPGLVFFFSGSHVAQFLVFCMVFCRPLIHISFHFSKNYMLMNMRDYPIWHLPHMRDYPITC
jgi:hypothetical protein